eukprot:CAMPEP_0169264238 /NCGR_PEP_ID=MMETSP1016-20121227/44948_1 /TAXON_ID=342587 /ORGANISM="Karlodinium micrum, Strain CCMP2283" /LENGTH=47 /DNA_ID= /DNA_START= /DNA_END= /DNA_ORIENTATION=
MTSRIIQELLDGFLSIINIMMGMLVILSGASSHTYGKLQCRTFWQLQ